MFLFQENGSVILKLTITEWKTVAYIEDEGQYSLLLENGETFPAEHVITGSGSAYLEQFQ